MTTSHYLMLLATASLAIGIGCSTQREAQPQIDVEQEISYCRDKIMQSLSELADSDGVIDYTQAPRNICGTDTRWACRPACAEEWCGGFWPGILWYAYQATGDNEIAYQADKYTRALQVITEQPVLDHGLGFLFFCSYGNGYRLTGNPDYKRQLLTAADSLATLYNPAVGTLLAWPRHVADYGGHNTIMDTMINLELLFWAAKNGGDYRLYDMAVAHADTTMRYQFRPDYTSYHVAVYDPVTGKFLRCCTHQGYSDDSMWARGQAWAIYGYTMVYRETHEPRFLDFAEHVTDAYLERLPDDMVPYWDFNDPAIPDAPRDASAACVVASALLELKDYVDAPERDRYRDAAVEMLKSLCSDRYKAGSQNSAFLLHSTGHHPAGSEIDASIVYADYYFLEALERMERDQHHSVNLAKKIGLFPSFSNFISNFTKISHRRFSP